MIAALVCGGEGLLAKDATLQFLGDSRSRQLRSATSDAQGSASCKPLEQQWGSNHHFVDSCARNRRGRRLSRLRLRRLRTLTCFHTTPSRGSGSLRSRHPRLQWGMLAHQPPRCRGCLRSRTSCSQTSTNLPRKVLTSGHVQLNDLRNLQTFGSKQRGHAYLPPSTGVPPVSLKALSNVAFCLAAMASGWCFCCHVCLNKT